MRRSQCKRAVVALLIAGSSSLATLHVVDRADCVIITPYDTVLYDPVIGEDTGDVYCPTGEVSNLK